MGFEVSGDDGSDAGTSRDRVVRADDETDPPYGTTDAGVNGADGAAEVTRVDSDIADATADSQSMDGASQTRADSSAPTSDAPPAILDATPADLGALPADATVTDGRLEAPDADVSDDLIIISAPITTVTSTSKYTYEVRANWTGPQAWSLPVSPPGMTIQPTTGVINWNHGGTIGSYSVTVQVEIDDEIATQTFTLRVVGSGGV